MPDLLQLIVESHGDPILDAKSDGEVILDEEKSKMGKDILSKAINQMSFLRQLISMGKVRKSDVATHLGLLRYTFEDLAELLDSGETLSLELDKAKAAARAANLRIRELEQQLGMTMTGDNVAAGVKAMEDILIAWYELTGFRYASIEFYQNGIRAEFTSDIRHENDLGDGHLSTQEIREALKPVPYGFKENYDLSRDSFHDYLLDTDNNRSLLSNLFTSAFPNSHIYEFKSRRDRNIYLLRTAVYIPFRDISALKKEELL